VTFTGFWGYLNGDNPTIQGLGFLTQTSLDANCDDVTVNTNPWFIKSSDPQ
jgi:hypothetical protein